MCVNSSLCDNQEESLSEGDKLCCRGAGSEESWWQPCVF